MTEELILAYLVRAFDRQREASILDAQMSRSRVMAEASKAGALQSGRTLLSIKTEYVRVVQEAGAKMSRHAFDAAGSNAQDVIRVIQKALTALRDAISNDLADFFRRGGSWAGALGQSLGNDYLHETDKIISSVVDDFSHGILEGVRLTKDPLVSVISSITNSPGAVMQSGVGNIQKVLTSGGASALRDALGAFLNSSEVQSLPAEDKQGLTDVAEVLSSELEKPSPDASKLARWGAMLVEVAEKLGIAVAASGISHALFG